MKKKGIGMKDMFCGCCFFGGSGGFWVDGIRDAWRSLLLLLLLLSGGYGSCLARMSMALLGD